MATQPIPVQPDSRNASAGPIKQTAPAMRTLLYVASGLVFIVGIPLYLFSTRTATLFAWDVESPIAAAFLGAGYWASFLIEFLSARDRQWARARIAVPAVLVFTFLTLLVTLQHLTMFHFDAQFAWFTRIGTWTWLAVYALVPLLMAVVLVYQLRLPGRDAPRAQPMATWVRNVLLAQGVIMLVLGVLFLLLPRTVGATVWPWYLAPMNAQATGAWLIGIGIIAVHAAWERDWLRNRNMMISYTVYAVLQLIVLLRYGLPSYSISLTGEPLVDWGRPYAALYLLFLLTILAVGLYGWRRAGRDGGAVATD